MKKILAVVVLALCTALPAAAQDVSTTRGFAVGLHLLGAVVDPEDGDDDGGAGLGFNVSYGFRNGLSIFLQGDGARIDPNEDDDADEDSYNLGVGELGVRYTFSNERARFRPFLDASLGGVSASVNDIEIGTSFVDAEIRGPAFTVGGGVDYYLTPSLALGAALRWSAASIDELEVGNITIELDDEDELDLRVTRLRFGLQYFFSGR